MAEPHLTDSNVLLRLVKRDHPDYPLVRRAVAVLHQRGAALYYTLQNMAEFWNVSTRPLDRNGFGLSVAEADEGACEIEQTFTLLPDSAAVYREWRRLVVVYRVRGAKVHDARLAAVLSAYGLRHLLTMNEADFGRYPGVVVVTPENLAGASTPS